MQEKNKISIDEKFQRECGAGGIGEPSGVGVARTQPASESFHTYWAGSILPD